MTKYSIETIEDLAPYSHSQKGHILTPIEMLEGETGLKIQEIKKMLSGINIPYAPKTMTKEDIKYYGND